VTDYQIEHPSEFLPPLEDAKKEAQFLFSEASVKVIVEMLKQLNYQKIISMGTPRIHEFVTNNCSEMDSFLMDFDSRFHNFHGPLQFCWYNSFNNHFFLPESETFFSDFLKGSKLVALNHVIITHSDWIIFQWRSSPDVRSTVWWSR
jgi:hypothetical protein